MPYTPPSSSLSSANRPGLAFAGPPSLGLHGRHNSEPVITLPGHSKATIYPSSSYIYRHRRSSSVAVNLIHLRPNSNVHSGGHSPNQPGNGILISNGAIPSPPESRRNSSDEDEGHEKDNGNRMFVELEAAIMSIDQQNSNSKGTPKAQKAPSLGLSSLGSRVQECRRRSLCTNLSPPRRPRTADGIILYPASEIATQTPDQSDEEDSTPKPPMIRKKSGELVRPALRARPRPTSMPGTPTFAKAVHFNSQLEQVRHFLQLDMPVAVSAGSSPVENYDGDTEFPFGFEDPLTRRQSSEWEVEITNFPDAPEARKDLPVRLERVYLSSDKKSLIGVLTVANIAFHKHVVARFTTDYWKTVSEVVAEYNNDGRSTQPGYDRFHFSIRLANLVDLESKTMFLCLRYTVNGLEFWDNNNSMNYHIDFSRKYKQESGKNPSVRSPLRTHFPRSQSLPPVPDNVAFAAARSFEIPQDDGFAQCLQKPTLTDEFASGPPTRRTKQTAQAFGNRYDFGSSLSAAMSSEQPKAPGLRTGIPRKSRGTSPQSTSYEPSSEPSKPTDLISSKPYHQSPVYKELVDKYCFFEPPGSKAKPQSHSSQSGQLNGDHAYAPSDSSSSASSSPIEEQPPALLGRQPLISDSPGSRSDFGSRPATPLFPYSYSPAAQSPLLSESPTPTPILG